jgi:hypothetical protein
MANRELDRLLDLKPTDVEGSHLRATIAVTASDKLLVFLTRRDVAATNNESERALRPSVIFRKVTNGFRSEWGAKVYADLCSIVATGRLAGFLEFIRISGDQCRRMAFTRSRALKSPSFHGTNPKETPIDGVVLIYELEKIKIMTL